MRQPITWTRHVPAITAVDTGRADSLFRLAAAWSAHRFQPDSPRATILGWCGGPDRRQASGPEPRSSLTHRR
jgi:hypothetical protein